ncbi:extracellular cell wall glucanase [Cordyceps fumosorosea ARSEF 2679]|uniref:chitinase n=1 Tax=Cordyceps fumosorosea (strain ARSEF 2679) TaxID=1081104 RepID=A0A167ZHB4_CORFA|nr:extracellular cell wall glucanase [Cordyceps fumosorosea ARSEF 2679]OAA67517.1 extracellular cell wall glucanase [Cordyceps fumosorosea ARSEF 2679]
MRIPFRIAAGTALLATTAAQTWSKCNPLQQTSCPPNTALGMTIDVDFTKGSVNSFEAQGVPSYSSTDGATFTVAASGDAPQLNSLFYIMFGRVEITMRAAPGAGIVSSLVLESDDLDEIDVEWLGSNPNELQSNYFGKGRTTDYNRGRFHAVPAGTQNRWVTYAIDWTQDRIQWIVDGAAVRELRRQDADQDQYPQTPMQVKFGTWAGGDPSRNPPGTVEWARGPTDFSKGPFSMTVRSLRVTDYSTGKQYRYKDTSGSWQSIEAVGGQVNGNAGASKNAPTVTATGVAPPTTSGPGVPVGGMVKDGSPATKTQTGWPWVGTNPPTGGSIPSGWYMTSSGKIMRSAAAALATPSLLLSAVSASVAVGVAIFMGRTP